jgi:Transposase, Mutator family
MVWNRMIARVEEHIDETLSFYRLPRQHHKHLKLTNLLERLNEEIKRRTHVVRIFPNGESCLRLIRALAVETHETWLEAHRYLNMEDLREHKKEACAWRPDAHTIALWTTLRVARKGPPTMPILQKILDTTPPSGGRS